ncbi:hypothetical protein GF1_02720 [Desulfolithobacter dissulfuricans]|uniref:DUF3373 domain-containing protein n=1 Tax=Desulfolithobacter dissulfuricans TaxID=2795293 RepID=A0A915U8D8_9BACT|nr:DUF3373 family protein [Desulfolithobacter dissulfuricans]BCO07896.1 hypothetical protein GF1_02720 [Desulfolithobacter dissulfuricans]
MVKKFSMLALAGLIALPAVASASAGKAPSDLEAKIEELSRQLDALKAQMAKQSEVITEYGDRVDDMDEMLEEKGESWDLAARFKFYGDFRARMDYYQADTVFSAGTPLQFPTGFSALAAGTSGGDLKNDTIFTNRFRLNMRVKATENVEFKGRLAMYKAWGMESTPEGIGDMYNNGTAMPIFDGNTTRTPDDNALRVDRAFVNWNNIGGMPIWFSIGRRPTTDGPPAQVRMGTDQRMATPIAYMDYPFDGISLGYAYAWGNEALGTGRIRFCYGRGFENGLLDEAPGSYHIDDTDFAGLSWDVFKKGHRFMNIQSFKVFNLFNYPDFLDLYSEDNLIAPQYGPQDTLGNMYHTTAIYMDKVNNFSYFIAGGWSRTEPDSSGMFNEYDMSLAAILGNGGVPPVIANTDSENGYSIYVGVRYDIDDLGLKIGAEYNYGSRYWVAFTPGNDDLYNSKLATRGNAYEIYMIYDLPTGEAISKYAKTFVRLGWQYYDYNYSGINDWNLKPYDLDDANDLAMLQSLGMNPIENANQIYLSFDVYF